DYYCYSKQSSSNHGFF
nr:immunoglobulin light chain junction region [Macaca mulatta]